MATSMSMSSVSGYPTQTSMKISVSFSVTYKGSYYTYYELYDYYTDELIDEAQGSTFSMSANSSKRNLYKTFSGLEPGTKYYIVGSLWNASTDVRLSIKEPTITFTTKEPVVLTVNFYDGSDYDVYTTEDYIDLYAGSRSGWTFVGWATSTGTTSVAYEAGDRIYVGSSSSSINLYAVYKKETTIYCYFIKGNTGAIASNSRTKIQYRVNVSKTSYSTGYYNDIVLPTFDSINSTISTSTPNREWSAIGWNKTTSAENPDYSPGQSVSSDRITGDLYAIYSNECSITYNANGGSGTMSKQTGTGYYNAYGKYAGVTFTIKDCTFTPPSGKRFGSWNQKADGSGNTYSSSVTTSYNITLYAIWVKARPSNWSWSTTGISKGSSMAYTQSGSTITPKPLTAKEWLSFMNRVKEFYTYKGKTVDSTNWSRAVNGVSSGSEMTATQANGARYLINQLSPPTSVPASVSSGTVITAAFINGLKNSLNSIP